MKNQSELIDALNALRNEKHDILDTYTIEEIDRVIELLKQEDKRESKSNATNNEIIERISAVLIKLPSIIELIKMFFDE